MSRFSRLALDAGAGGEAVEEDGRLVERLQQINNQVGGSAFVRLGDPLEFFQEDAPRYQVVHHQGLLHHFPVPWVRAILAQQVARAEWVVEGRMVQNMHSYYDRQTFA